MKSQRRTQVLSRGEIVGELIDAIPDMWYLEGAFAPMQTQAAERFVQAASSLDAKAVDQNPKTGIRVLVRDNPDAEPTVFLVMSLSGGRLFGRLVLAREAVDWALKNIPE